MLRKKLTAVLALVVVIAFVLQAGPMYIFAEPETETVVPADEQTAQSDGNVNEEDVSFYIDENGNKTELTDEMREEIYAEDEDPDNSAFYAVDADSFFAHDENEVQVAADSEATEEDQKAVAADAAALAIPGSAMTDSMITNDFDLPVKGGYGSTITWTSSNTDILSVDNETGHVTVTRPEYSSGVVSYDVTLTAVVSKNGASEEKVLSSKVAAKKPGDNQALADSDAEILDFPVTDVNGDPFSASEANANFVMPVKGFYGSVITYESSDSKYVSVDNETGTVTINRPPFTGANTQEYTITATVQNGSAKAEKTLNISVVEQDPATDYEKALYDANNAIIGGVDIDNVRTSSFYLEDKGKYGSLSWETSDENVVSIKEGDYVHSTDTSTDTEGDGEGNEEDLPPENQGGFTAMVTRPENGYDAYVTLKLTAMVGGESVSREFNLTILADDGIRAFPSAEGYGQYSKGGRGGQVYHVTNLNASGPGSLQYGVEEMSGARTIVFDVGGVIDLTQYGANLRLKGVKGANVTIAGQTAPYPGITLKGYGLDINSTHDVIIRNIRIRIGDVLEDGIYNQTDPMSIGSTNNLVVDHCTFHWAIDMDFRVAGQNVTFSNMLMGKGLTINSTHEKGGHAYVGAINEGSARVSFIKNMVTDSTQRSPRLVDAEYVDAYNNLLYDCGNGFDVYNYETQGQNSKYNVYQNFMRTGPTQSNKTPLRIGRGRAYAGGVMGYVEDNYYTGENNDSSFIAVTNGIENVPTNGILNFGEANLGKVADLSNITLSDWDNDPRSYDNNNKQNPAGTITYMDYPFPAPRGDVIDIDNNEPGVNNPLVKYALDEDGLGQGMGVTKPARDLYDTMIMAELKAGKVTQTGLTKSQVAPFFDALERRVKEPGVDENGNRTMVPVDYEAHRAVVKDDNAVSGFSYSDPQNYKTGRIWTILQGGGPAVVGSGSGTNNKPINWDSYTDVNRNTNPTATSKYVESYTTDFEIGDWWGEYCGSPGKVLVYTVHDPVSGRFTTTTDYDSIDQTKYEIMSVEPKYIEVKRTVADLIPAQWVYDRDARHADEEGYKPVAPFMINYMLNKYPYLDSYSNYEEFQIAKANGTLSEFDFDHNYTNQEITWDGMGDGIPNWYKEYRGWSTTQYVASNTDPETGYTYLEEYINFMADDEPINIDQSPAKAENFKIIQSKLGYSSVQLSWNTNYRATCVIEYGTEPGKYDKSVALDYSNAPDGYHTYHDISIGALQPDTTYYYRVTTTDELGNTTYSEGEKQQFKTEPLPAGSNIMPTKPTVDDVVPYLNQIRLNWTGNPATDEGYEIYYDTVDHGQDYTAYANKLTGLSLYTNKQIITGLENNIQYYFLVVATNSNGKTPSDVIASTPSGVMYNFNFSEMSYPERDEFIKKQFMYILGGQVSMQPDPDTGKYVLMLLDETNSHGVNTNLRLPVTQTDKMTYEVRLKLLYQKQTDALNGNIFPNQKESSKDSLTKTGEPEHNTWQVNFSQDPNVNEDLDSRKTKLWDSAFSIYFDPYSDPISTEYIDRDVVDVDGNSTHFQGNRYDGTVETPTFKFGTTVIGNGYSIGRTIATSPGPVDDNRPYRLKKLKATGNDKEAYNTILQSPENGHDLIESEISTDKYQLPLMKDVITTYQCESCGNLYYEDAVSTPVAELTTCPNCGEKIILEGEEANFKKVKTETNWSTGYTNPSTYSFKTPYGDAFFSDQADTDKTLHSLWYYEKGSAQFVDLKVVVDIRNNMVSVSLDGNELYKLGQFSKDLDPPYNIGKIELKSRNDGYSWVNVESIKISNGDGTTSIDPPPVQPGATKPISPGGGGGGGGGGSLSTNATPGPEATADPNATAAPAATAAPSTAVYTDLGDVDWAVEAINALSAMGIVNGTGDGKFSPNDNVTRAEYTTMLMRAFGGDTTAAAASFTDVSAGEWYTEPIGKAVALGVVNGYEDGSFGIDDNITREDMMVIAYRTTSALNMAVPETIPYESFADQSSISDYAVEAVEKMYSAEIINGVGDGLLDPKGNATRAQSAKIIYGLINMEGTVNE